MPVNKDFRNLPGVDKVLSDGQIERLSGKYPHDLLVNIIRQRLDDERASIAAGKPCAPLDEIAASVVSKLESLDRPTLRRVINASGVILHTNLGRAPLSQEALAEMKAVSEGYSNLEFKLDTGVRGSRHVHVEDLL